MELTATIGTEKATSHVVPDRFDLEGHLITLVFVYSSCIGEAPGWFLLHLSFCDAMRLSDGERSPYPSLVGNVVSSVLRRTRYPQHCHRRGHYRRRRLLPQCLIQE